MAKEDELFDGFEELKFDDVATEKVPPSKSKKTSKEEKTPAKPREKKPMSPEKLAKIKKITLISAAAAALAVIIFVVVVCFIVPKVKANKLKKQQEQLAIELETARQQVLAEDLVNIETGEYDGVFLAMSESSGWNMDLIKAFIGKDMLKANGIYNSSEEFLMAWNAALTSGNDLDYCVFVIDPFKLYDAEEIVNEDKTVTTQYTLSFDYASVFADNPKTEFRVFTPCYTREYWEENYTEASFRQVIIAYRDMFMEIADLKNVSLSCFTGYKWLTDNPKNFNEDGGLCEKTYEELFLYNYRKEWLVTEKNLSEVLHVILDNLNFPDPVVEPAHWWDPLADLFGKKKEEAVEETYMYEGLSNYDVVFLGDSLFELNDGPFSIASCFETMTGARVYNLSKGGLSAAKTIEENPTIIELVEHIYEGKTFDNESYKVFDRDIVRFTEDDHTGRTLLIINDFGTNDYMFNVPLWGMQDSCYEGAMKYAYADILREFPDAELMNLGIYHISHLNNGTQENDCGQVLDDYNFLLEIISRETGAKYVDLEKVSIINAQNTGIYLNDGIHPSMAGCWEVARCICESLTK